MAKSHVQNLLILILGLGLISCSSSQKTSSTTVSSSFDASEYYNPYDLQSTIEAKLNSSDQTSGKITLQQDNFVPAKTKSGRVLVGVIREVSDTSRLNAVSNNKNFTELYLYIDERGVIQKIERGNTSDLNFESSLIKSLQRANYEPATLNGKPVKSVKRVSFNH